MARQLILQRIGYIQQGFILAQHSRANKILIRNQSLFMGTSQGQRDMIGGPECVFWEILANGAGQKKIKNWNQTL